MAAHKFGACKSPPYVRHPAHHATARPAAAGRAAAAAPAARAQPRGIRRLVRKSSTRAPDAVVEIFTYPLLESRSSASDDASKSSHHPFPLTAQGRWLPHHERPPHRGAQSRVQAEARADGRALVRLPRGAARRQPHSSTHYVPRLLTRGPLSTHAPSHSCLPRRRSPRTSRRRSAIWATSTSAPSMSRGGARRRACRCWISSTCC
jgi:hypothetical protein